MSWIKKIFTMFQNENDDEFNDIDQDQAVSKPVKNVHNNKRDIEAKVLYQYPKGQFRFPLIPDGEQALEKTKPRKERQERVSQVDEIKPFTKEKGSLRITNERQSGNDRYLDPQRESFEDNQSTFKQEPVRKPAESSKPKKPMESAAKFHYETRKDSGPKFRQPFKPTEIPSPIYAFNRPPRKSQIQTSLEDVEFELTGFDRSKSSLDEQSGQIETNNMTPTPAARVYSDSTVVHKKEMTQEIYIEDDLAETEDHEAAEIEEQLIQSDLETEALDIILHNEPEFCNQEPLNEKMTEPENELVVKEPEAIRYQQGPEKTEVMDTQVDREKIEVVESQNDPVAIEVNIAQNDSELVEVIESQNVPEEIEVIESQIDHEEVEVSESQIEEEETGVIESQIDQEETEVIEIKIDQEEIAATGSQYSEKVSGETDVHQSGSGIPDYQQKTEEEYVQPGQDAEAEASNVESEEVQIHDADPMIEHKPAEPKRQLPFNVLMLKQDKRKWEARNTSKYPSFMTEGRKPGSEQSLPAEGETQSDVEETLLKEEDKSSMGNKSTDIFQQNESATSHPSAAPMNTQAEEKENEPYTRDEPLQTEVHPAAVYDFPPLDLLSPPVFKAPDPEWLMEQEQMLNETLRNFNVGARVVNVTQGPSVTRFEVQPEPGVKVNKITNLSDDIKLSLAAKDIRIEAPIPGKHTIGIEVPNHTSRPVLLSEILQSAGFMDLESPLSVALGLDIAGNPIVTDLKKMPHGLIAGATGSGKSVCINTMLVSLLYKAHPDEVKLLLIDPKMVELAPYNRIPHLVSPVITDVKAATASLKWAVEEMERRYELFAHTGVRDISRFNELAEKHRRFSQKLPYIVIVIDELADLMMMAPGDVEEAICRIAQKARACGIHLIIATQRPSVDVITGLIKANVPTRIAFSVSSQVDSRTIIDISGAEKLLGRGDMLFLENGSSKPFRLQGTFVTDNEIDDIVAFVREQRDPQYLFEQDELLKKAQVTEDEDELFYEACEFVIDQGGASTSSVQRRFKIGYNRAARLIEMMEQHGFISEGKGSRPRDVLITAADLEAFQETSAFN